MSKGCVMTRFCYQGLVPFGEPNRSSVVVRPTEPVSTAYLTHRAGSDSNTCLREFG